MTLSNIIPSIVDHLQDNITNLKVERFPARPETYEIRHPKGVILIHYAGMQTHSYKTAIQFVDLRFELNLILRNLNDADEAEPYIAAIIKSMTNNFFIEGKLFEWQTTDYLWSEEGLTSFSLIFNLKNIPYIQGEDL